MRPCIFNNKHPAIGFHGNFMPYVPGNIVNAKRLHIGSFIMDSRLVYSCGNQYGMSIQQNKYLVGMVMNIQFVNMLQGFL